MYAVPVVPFTTLREPLPTNYQRVLVIPALHLRRMLAALRLSFQLSACFFALLVGVRKIWCSSELYYSVLHLLPSHYCHYSTLFYFTLVKPIAFQLIWTSGMSAASFCCRMLAMWNLLKQQSRKDLFVLACRTKHLKWNAWNNKSASS